MKTLKQLCKKYIRFSSDYGAARSKGWEGNKQNWRVTLHNDSEGQMMECDYFGGSAVEDISCEDVVDSLLLDARATDLDFEDWCGEFGCDTDSRKAYAIWESCKENGEQIKMLLGEKFEMFMKSERP